MAKNIKDVELFLFDLDGTVYIGDNEIEGSFAAVNRLREMGKRICFFTNNSSRMHTDYIARLNNLGLRVYSDEIYTSGQVTCEYLLDNYRGKRVFLLGNDRLRAEFEMYGINLVDDDPDLAVIGFDTSLTYDKLYRFCRFVNEGMPFIATHPDNFCPAEGCPMPDVGAMLSAIKLTVGREPDLVMGKPHRTAGERIARKYNLPPAKSRWWATGSTRTSSSARTAGSSPCWCSRAKRRRKPPRRQKSGPITSWGRCARYPTFW